MDNHAQAYIVLPLNGFSFVSFILIYGWFLLANGACIHGIADVIYMGIEKTPWIVQHANLPSLPTFTKP